MKVNADRCNGCLTCEMICSAFHSEPKFSRINPARARIRVTRDPLTDTFVPLFSGDYTRAQCAHRYKDTINGKEYGECAFCRVCCPSRDYFKEPDSGLPLTCDGCEGEEEPMCVKFCHVKALTYEEREEGVEEETQPEGVEIGLESLVNKYGLEKVVDTVARITKKG